MTLTSEVGLAVLLCNLDLIFASGRDTNGRDIRLCMRIASDMDTSMHRLRLTLRAGTMPRYSASIEVRTSHR
jgi:hypothetical protein